jgi:hypothetical protein
VLGRLVAVAVANWQDVSTHSYLSVKGLAGSRIRVQRPAIDRRAMWNGSDSGKNSIG